MKHHKLNKVFAMILTFTLLLSFLPQVYVPTALAAATNLPSGWTDVAMNDGIASGNAMVKSTSADYDSTTQTFTIAGSEGKLQSTGDSAYFVNTTISGDFVATVRVASFAPFGTSGTTTAPQAMLMLKNGTAKTSNGFYAVFNNTNVLAYKRYSSTGTVNASPAIAATAPFYLRLEKVGNKYNTYYSKDGSAFGTAYATITDSTNLIDSASNDAALNIGLAVTEANVKFDNLVIKRADGTVIFGGDPAPPPSSPTGLTVVNPGSNANVNLSWTAASGAASYTIKRGTQSGIYTDLATIPSVSTTYADTAAVNGTQYFYVVTAKNAAGIESASSSNEVWDTPVLPRPNAPTGLTANAGDTQVTLNWTAAVEAQSYTIKYATASGGPYTSVTGIASNSYTLKGLTNNTTYYFTVSAVNGAGTSQDSAEVQATPMTTPPPQAPTGVMAAGADAKVSVSWSAVNGANSYSVKRSTDGQNFTTVASGLTVTNYTDTGLTNGTTYHYVVTAVNPQGESGNSAVVSAVPAQLVAGSPVISKSGGWFETAYVEWAPVSNAQGYNVYVKPASASDSLYVQMDTQLIRQYPTYWRADAVGLPAGAYVMKVEALFSDGSSKYAVSDILSVSKYDRSGFAFSSQSPLKTSSGAYNDDGSLRSGAQVIYVTSATARTVTLDVITSSKGAKTTGTGIGEILTLRQKGYDQTPLAIRLIGQVTKADMSGQLNSSGYLEVKGKSAYTEMNVTLEGIGEDTYAYGWGFLVRNAGNVELRNIGMMRFPDDAFSMDTKNVNIWVHNNDLFYGDAGSDADQVKGDGSTDIKGSSTYITISYNHYWDSGKSSLSGLSEPSEYFVTFHHNWFDHSDSRHPRVRVGTIHVYNNYYDGVSKYGVGATTGSSIFVESNYWRNAHDPMMISLQGTDIKDGVANGTFSSESGGMIKAYNNIITNPNSLIYANSNAGTAPANPTSFDAYLASSRNETVPSSYKALVGGAAYNNFDTLVETAVDPANIDDVNNIPQIVTKKAGRLNQGDFTWQFNNAVDDALYVVNTALKNKTLAYTTQLVAVGGNSTQQTIPAPSAPTGLTATAGDAQVALTWTAVSGAASYNIKRSTTNGSGYTQFGTSVTASYTDTSVTNGTTYYYVVEATNTAGTSAASTQASATPAAVNNGGSDGSGSGTTLINDTFESTATLTDLGYSVIVPNPSAGTALDASIAAPSTALQGSTKSLYLHDTDKSASTQLVKVNKAFAPQSGVITNEFDYMLTAAASATKVVRLLSSTGAVAVEIQTVKNGSATVFSYKTVPAGQSSAIDNFMAGYAINTWYHFKIVADVSAQTADVYINGTKQNTTPLPFYTATTVSDIGSFETSTPGSNTIDQYLDNISLSAVGGDPVDPAPASPTGLTAAPGDAQVALAWTAVNGATSYNIKRSTTSGSGYTQVGTSLAASYTDSGLTNGTTYYYVVEAVNSAGTSPASAQVSETPTAPATITIPSVTESVYATGGSSQVDITWATVMGATYYNVKRSLSESGPFTNIAVNLTVNSYSDTSVTNGTTYYYVVTAANTAGESEASIVASATPRSSTSGGGCCYSAGSASSTTVTTNKDGSVSINMAATTQKTTDGKTAAVVTLDSATLDQALSNNNKTVVVEVKSDETVAQVNLPASSLLNASKQSSNTVLVVKFDNATYALPVSLLNIDSLAKSIGADVKDLKVNIVIEQISGSQAAQIANATKQAGAQLLTPAVDFTVTVEAGGKSVSVNDFGNTYVSRSLELSSTVDSKQATAVMIDPATGEMTFVPATFQVVDGKTKVTISRPGNSIYSVVQFDKSFADMKDHWAKGDVELLASKLLVKGRTEITFDPQSSISRAEFAAMLVRGLGLGEDKTNKFKDVSASDWYMGIVGSASKAGLIEGDESGKFNPNASITREEMAVMIDRAMVFVGKKTSGDVNQLNAFKDASAISPWAKDAVAKGVTAGLLNGKSANAFEPSATASRAEAAVLLKRLLQTVGFIN
ncbi:fibronectin type III domain-containing protein [Paenibacillus planticolens]|uniref:Pectate lyase n=1 Tax=Paenibacillus planticolens TaxID=2654976 RepID=A0ABX1ZNV6_9BACL|nr:S-layer homology domain-containing protein [Paenibacillus planticolens]NOV01767.1 hypothetical protein [Paenibacillus planticolens]